MDKLKGVIPASCPRSIYQVATAPAFVAWSAAPVPGRGLLLCAGSASPDRPTENVIGLRIHDAQSGQVRADVAFTLEHPGPELLTSAPLWLPSGEILLGVYARDEWLKLVLLDERGATRTVYEIAEQPGEDLSIFGYDAGNKLFIGRCAEVVDTNRYHIVSWLYRQRSFSTAVLSENGTRAIFPEYLLAAQDGVICGIETPHVGERIVARDLRSTAPIGTPLWTTPGAGRHVLGIVSGLLWVLDYSARDVARTVRKDAFLESLVDRDAKYDRDDEARSAAANPLRTGVSLTALELRTGVARWSMNLDGEPIAASLGDDRGALSVTNEDRADEIIVLASSGQPIAQLPSTQRSFPPAGPHLDSQRGHAILAIDAEKLLLLQGRALRCVAYAPEVRELWQLELPPSCHIEGFSARVAERRLAAPTATVHEGAIYLRSDAQLFCLSP